MHARSVPSRRAPGRARGRARARPRPNFDLSFKGFTYVAPSVFEDIEMPKYRARRGGSYVSSPPHRGFSNRYPGGGSSMSPLKPGDTFSAASMQPAGAAQDVRSVNGVNIPGSGPRGAANPRKGMNIARRGGPPQHQQQQEAMDIGSDVTRMPQADPSHLPRGRNTWAWKPQ